MTETIYAAALWLVTAIAITGTVLNARMVRAGFVFWIVSNTCLLAQNLHDGRWQQAALWGVYLGLAVYGLVTWGQKQHAERRLNRRCTQMLTNTNRSPGASRGRTGSTLEK